MLPVLLNAIRNSELSLIQEILEQKCLSQRELSLGLLEAVQTCYPEAVRLLIAAGADVNYRFGVGTALTEAIYLDTDEIASILLEAGADVSIPEFQSNYSSLELAVSRGKLSTVKLLVNYGADVNKVRDQRFALLHAVTEGHEDIFNYLEPLTCDSLKLQVEVDCFKDNP